MTEQFYLIRDDSFYCVPYGVSRFVNKFATLLQKYTSATVKIFDAKKQIGFSKQYLKEHYPDHKIISIDKWFQGDFNYDVSRIFEYGGLQDKPLQCQFSFYDQGFLAIAPKFYRNIFQYILLDDDIASGTTINFTKEKLREYFGIVPDIALSLTDIYFGKDLNVYDIVDIRDFIPNALHGGLKCYMPDRSIKRVPYLHPYVNLATRMKLTEENAILFTENLKQLQQEEFGYDSSTI